jgi:hypothetical protein
VELPWIQAIREKKVPRVLWLLRIPTPGPDEKTDPSIVTPGVAGFILTIAVAVAVVLLVIDMTRRIRRINYRAQVNERLDAEERAAAEKD